MHREGISEGRAAGVLVAQQHGGEGVARLLPRKKPGFLCLCDGCAKKNTHAVSARSVGFESLFVCLLCLFVCCCAVCLFVCLRKMLQQVLVPAPETFQRPCGLGADCTMMALTLSAQGMSTAPGQRTTTYRRRQVSTRILGRRTAFSTFSHS